MDVRHEVEERAAAALDLDLLLETVEVERGCCTFFDLAPDVHRRELVVSVADRERVPALDAIATAMGVS